jgi:tetratricopeptide (TPR) repeat protein
MTSSAHRCKDAARRERRAPRYSTWGLVLALVMTCVPVTTVFAEPYIPANDAVVLAQVPAASQLRQFQAVRRALAMNPDDLSAALALSGAYLNVGRSEGDPRFISYAQAVIAPWTARADAPVAALVLSATALQSVHRFDESLLLLERALSIDPANAQAWLTKATLLQVRGDFGAARRACVRLIGSSDQAVALACVAAANGMNGRLSESYRALEQIVANDARLSSELRSWLRGQLGEMAVRLGQDRLAETHFRTALQINPRDLYVKAEYADLLLRQRRAGVVIDLLQDNEAQDPLLLRLTLAGLHVSTAQGRRWSRIYEARYDDAQRVGDTTHLREQARYLLDVRGAPAAALRLAERNWQVQREPADIRIYWRAAKAAGDRAALANIAAWIKANAYEDATLTLRSSAEGAS